jgi:8-oxo-dGTP pyrophosphatase MutT (NUDIX family)
MILKVLAYITRQQGDQTQLLVFDHHGLPEAGTQVPAGTVEPDEPIETALWREVAEEAGLTKDQLELVAKLAGFESLQWGTTRHVFYLKVRTELPGTWQRAVTGTGEDNGLLFDYYWLPLTPELTLADNQHQWLGLIRA